MQVGEFMDSYDQRMSQVCLPRQCSPNNLRFCLHAFVQQLMVISSAVPVGMPKEGNRDTRYPSLYVHKLFLLLGTGKRRHCSLGGEVNQRSFVEEDSSASRLRTGRRPRTTGKYLNLSAPLLAREFEERHAML